MKVRCLEQIKFLDAAPSVPFHDVFSICIIFIKVPGDFIPVSEVEKKRVTQPKETEFYDNNDKNEKHK